MGKKIISPPFGLGVSKFLDRVSMFLDRVSQFLVRVSYLFNMMVKFSV